MVACPRDAGPASRCPHTPGAFVQQTLDAIESAPVDNPGTTPRPGTPGVQCIGIRGFRKVGDQCTELFSTVIAGRLSIDSALENCQKIASRVGR